MSSSNSIFHKFSVVGCNSYYDETLEDHIFTSIGYNIISIDTSKVKYDPSCGNTNPVVIHHDLLELDPVNPGNLVPYSEIADNRDMYFRQWVSAKVDILAIQNKHELELHDIT